MNFYMLDHPFMRVSHRSLRRRPRVFALDPSLSRQLDAADINETVPSIRWEDDLKCGPCGECSEVIDEGNEPLDLNQPALLAQDGVAPAEGDPKFDQQMVYAVCMKVVETVDTHKYDRDAYDEHGILDTAKKRP